ncbi:hypothetical protein LEP1GSC064_2679 [Leptospira kirschneri serovar Grippotyphosa str. Moskva]|nr:hypothetical protein LEP1GSC064_2679 [Leptospira kirschneri serovar Grippotyphosa str. Moskva]
MSTVNFIANPYFREKYWLLKNKQESFTNASILKLDIFLK